VTNLASRYNFEEQDFQDLVDLLKHLKGRFFLTINDTPEIRALFRDFKIENVELKYSVTRSKKREAKPELSYSFQTNFKGCLKSKIGLGK
jgi:DNA adenine methylase